ncbi:unnamed protein product [Brassica rapa subsp. trilocularis]
MTKLHNLRASEPVRLNPKDAVVPPFITDMEGKTFTFQVRVSAYNFTAHHQTFTITRILNEHERIPVPDFVVDVRMGGDDADDDDKPDGSPVPVQTETGESSIDAAKNGDDNTDGLAPENIVHPANKEAKKARVV